LNQAKLTSILPFAVVLHIAVFHFAATHFTLESNWPQIVLTCLHCTVAKNKIDRLTSGSPVSHASIIIHFPHWTLMIDRPAPKTGYPFPTPSSQPAQPYGTV